MTGLLFVFRTLLRRLRAGIAAALASSLLFASPAGAAGPQTPDPSASDPRPVLTIGIVDEFPPETWPTLIGPTLENLRKALPQYRFRAIEILSRKEARGYRDSVDFFLSASLFYWTEHLSQGAAAVAAAAPAWSRDPTGAVAGLVLARAKDNPSPTLAHLRGKVLAAPSGPENLEYLALRGVIEKRGVRSDRFFREVKAVGWRNPGVATALLAGTADAGVLPLCAYEELAARGAVSTEEIIPVEARLDLQSGCLATTDLYPGAVLSAMPRAQPEAVTAVAQALFAMPRQSGRSWMVANDFTKADELAELLALGPYAYLQQITPEALWKRFPTECVIAASLAFALLLHLARVNLLVRRRTSELRRALAAKDELEARARKGRESLASLERLGLINQLSSLIAHELKQPVGAVSNYAAGLLCHIRAGAPDMAVITDVLERIRSQARRASDVIEYVRSEARGGTAARTRRCDLARVVSKAVEIHALSSPEACRVWAELPEGGAPALIDPRGIELAVYNLVKNAAEAAAGKKDAAELMKDPPRVTVRIADAGSDWLVSVRDNGPRISDEAFAALGTPLASMKEQGLGLGVTLVRHMLERSGSRLAFERNDPEPGLTASFRIAKSLSESDGKSSGEADAAPLSPGEQDARSPRPRPDLN